MVRVHGSPKLNRQEPKKPTWLLGLLIALCIILVVAGIITFLYLRQKPKPPEQPPIAGGPTPPPPATAPAIPPATQPPTIPPTVPPTVPPAQPPALVSDDRVIFGGMPRAKKGNLNLTVLKNKAYTVGFSEERKIPMWAAYRVIRMEEPFILARPKGDFKEDPRIGIRLTHQDYTGSGYDRGHMAPNSAIARCFGLEAQRETFLMTNICPQTPNLNQKVWENLERAEIGYGNRYGEVWVVDGPIFPGLKDGAGTTGGGDDGSAGRVKKLRSGVHIPESFFKILVHDASGGRGLNVETCAVIMPQNVKGTEPGSQFTVTINEIEEQTGLEFLWQLPPEVQQRIKSRKASLWPSRSD